MDTVRLAEKVALSPILSLDEKRFIFRCLAKNDQKERKVTLFNLRASASRSSSWVLDEETKNTRTQWMRRRN